MRDWCKSYFCNEANSELNQIVIAFVWGLLFGSISWGLIWLIVFLIIYEIFIFYVTEGLAPYWGFLVRVAVIAATLIGWVLGRWLIIGYTGFEFMMRKC